MFYVLTFFIIIFLVSVLGGSKLFVNHKNWQNTYLVVFVGLFLLIGLRSRTVGTDTTTYVYQFLGKQDRGTLMDIFQNEPEPFYTLLLVFCQKITDSYTIFLLVFALPISLAFALFLKDHTEDYFLSVVIFAVLGIMYFSMAGLRQTMALGIVLFAFRFAYKRKFFPFLCLCLLAMGFHNTAIIFLLVYPLMNMKVNWTRWLFVAVALVLGLTRNGLVLRVANFLLQGDRFDHYFDGSVDSSLSLTLFLIQFLFLFVCYLFKGEVLKKDPQAAIFYHMAFMGLIFQAFTPIRGEFFRISMYFSVALCVLVPKAVLAISDKKTQSVAYIVMCICGLAYIFVLPGSWVYTYRLFI